MQEKQTIKVDRRERNSGIAAMLGERGYYVEEAFLPIGDFVLGDLIIERKTVTDFQISIIDGRLFRQIYLMRQNYARCLLIVEDNAEEKEDAVHINAAQGALIRVTSAWQVPYLYSQSPSHTVGILELIFAQEGLQHDAPAHKARWGYSPRTADRKRRHILEGISGIGPKRATSLLRHFGSLRAIFNASPTELAAVDGIHASLAAAIQMLVSKDDPSQPTVRD